MYQYVYVLLHRDYIAVALRLARLSPELGCMLFFVVLVRARQWLLSGRIHQPQLPSSNSVLKTPKLKERVLLFTFQRRVKCPLGRLDADAL